MKNKYTPQFVRKLTKRNATLLAITALALCAAPAVALAADCLAQTTWIDHTGSWFDCTNNWSNGTCPDSGTAALIDNGGTAQITASLPVANACALTLGDSNNSGNVSVSLGTLHVTNNVDVGNPGTGSLSVSNGGTVTSGPMSVGETSSATSATGLLAVSDTAAVTAASVQVNPTGTLSGYGTVSTTSGTTIAGTLAPKGGGTTLTIGGALTFFGSAATMQCNVTPQDPSTTPQVSVSGQVSLGGHLLVTMSGDFSSAPTRFTLLNAGSVNNDHRFFDFTSITYPTDQCWTPKINYVTDNDGHYHVYLDRIVCTN